jgi:hypothetical protein
MFGKKLLAGLVLALTLSFSASAEPVFLYPFCNYGPASGECTLNNTSGKNVTCNIQAQGQTRNGSMLSGFQYVMLYPGMFAWVRVNAYNPVNDPIVYLSATAFCNTTN